MRKSWIGVSVALCVVGSAASANAAPNTASSRSNTQHNTIATQNCPQGEHKDSQGQCVKDEVGAVNYNSSKSNTGNLTVQPAGAPGQAGMAVKGSGVPTNGSTTQTGNTATQPSTPH